MRAASIDIGTNTVRCLICDVAAGILVPVELHRRIVRVGAGLRERSSLGDGPLARLREVLLFFGRKVRESSCHQVRAVATSAFRETGNRRNFLEEMARALTCPIEVISPEEEASLTVLGAQAGVGELEDGTIFDIGGGSTEIIRIVGGNMTWWTSIPEGVVYLTEEFLRDDPPSPAQTDSLGERFRSLLPGDRKDGGSQTVGTAGTPTTLASIQLGIDVYNPSLVNGQVLSREVIAHMKWDLVSMDSAARLRLPGMEKGREDVIVAGILLVEEIMDHWGYDNLKVSDWGLLEGVALSAAEGKGTEINGNGE